MMSFWEREVRIYKIAPESGADAESQRNQLVGRVLIPVSSLAMYLDFQKYTDLDRATKISHQPPFRLMAVFSPSLQ